MVSLKKNKKVKLYFVMRSRSLCLIYWVATPATQTYFVILPGVHTCSRQHSWQYFWVTSSTLVRKRKKKICLARNLYSWFTVRLSRLSPGQNSALSFCLIQQRMLNRGPADCASSGAVPKRNLAWGTYLACFYSHGSSAEGSHYQAKFLCLGRC